MSGMETGTSHDGMYFTSSTCMGMVSGIRLGDGVFLRDGLENPGAGRLRIMLVSNADTFLLFMNPGAQMSESATLVVCAER